MFEHKNKQTKKNTSFHIPYISPHKHTFTKNLIQSSICWHNKCHRKLRAHTRQILAPHPTKSHQQIRVWCAPWRIFRENLKRLFTDPLCVLVYNTLIPHAYKIMLIKHFFLQLFKNII